jgi:hypothetical protein
MQVRYLFLDRRIRGVPNTCQTGNFFAADRAGVAVAQCGGGTGSRPACTSRRWLICSGTPRLRSPATCTGTPPTTRRGPQWTGWPGGSGCEGCLVGARLGRVGGAVLRVPGAIPACTGERCKNRRHSPHPVGRGLHRRYRAINQAAPPPTAMPTATPSANSRTSVVMVSPPHVLASWPDRAVGPRWAGLTADGAPDQLRLNRTPITQRLLA